MDLKEKNDNMGDKEALRKEIIRRLREQDALLRDERSMKIQKELLLSEEFKVSETVMTYVSMPTEVSTSYFNEEALKRGKRLLVPFVEHAKYTITATEITSTQDLEKGPFGIYQPKEDKLKQVPLGEIDLIVVPAIAYDKDNMRLGRGKGCYDKFLSSDQMEATTIGLAFSFQILESLPRHPHDRPVFRVITN